MKYKLFIILLTTTSLAFGQNSIDFEELTNSWMQGKIDENGGINNPDVNKGGWYDLDINSDSTVIFRDPFTCGFGQERHGKWILSKADTTVTFFFTKRLGYLNNPHSGDINEIEIYKIQRLTTDDLMLLQINGPRIKTWPFIRIEK